MRNRYSHNIRRLAGIRAIALILVFTMLIPQRAYAVGMLIDAGKQLFGSEEEQDNGPKSDFQGQFAGEADAVKQSLAGASEGQTKKLRLSAAKTLAIATNNKIEAYDMQIDAKTAKMQSAVRSLRERQRTMGTVRWSPIFNIKFPEKPKEVEAFEFEFKPTQLQNEITLIKHKITETQMDVNEKVSNTYIKIIAAQGDVDNLTARERKLKNTVAKLEIKVKDGTAAVEQGLVETDDEGNQTVVSTRILKARAKAAEQRLQTAQARYDKVVSELTDAKTQFLEAKTKLSTDIGFDCTNNYTFEDSFITASLSRQDIEFLYTYALEDDPGVYEAQMAHDEALLSLRVNYQLMKKQYSQYISLIEPYVQQALDGVAIPKKAFKKDYDQFLKDVDAYWKGSYKIWFVKIPREWLKGDTDGIRYVEDDPYVLYSAALDYETARKELDNAKGELHSTILEEYGNYAAARKVYLNANKEYILAEKQLGLDEVSYLLGELNQEEFEAEESDYEDLKQSAEDALADLSMNLYSFDRLTCGGVSKFFEGPNVDSEEALSLTPVIRTGVIYTIRPIIDSQEFLLSLDVPDDFYANTGIKITNFELWCDGHIIGSRTAVGKNLRHLMLSVRDLGECAIRVYDGNKFIDECRIEPTVYSGPLNITIGHVDDGNAHTIGKYKTSDDMATNMLVLTLSLDQEAIRAEYEAGVEAKYYRMCVAKDSYLLSDRLIPVTQTFTYMQFLRSDLKNVFIELFDGSMEKIGEAKFDTTSKELYHDVDEEEAAAIAARKKKKAIEDAKKAAEEEANAEALAREQRTKEILSNFGIPTTRKNIDFGLKHLSELEGAVDLRKKLDKLNEERDKAKEKYEALKNDPEADPAALKAAADRVRITEEMPKIYEEALANSIASNFVDKLNQSIFETIREYISEYALLYIKVHESTGDESDHEDDTARMTEIETEVKKLESTAIEDFKPLGAAFDEAVKKLYEYKAADFVPDSDIQSSIEADISTCSGIVGEIEKSEFFGMTKSKERPVFIGFFKNGLGGAICNIIKELGIRGDELNANFDLTVNTIKKEDYDFADSLEGLIKMLLENCKSAYASEADYKAVEADVDRNRKSILNYVDAVKEIWRARMLIAMSYNDTLKIKYDLMVPYRDIGDEYKALNAEIKAKEKELQDINKALGESEYEMKEAKAAYERYTRAWSIRQQLYRLAEGNNETDLKEKYQTTIDEYYVTKAKLGICEGDMATLQEKYKTMGELVYDYLGQLNGNRSDCKELIAMIEALGLEPVHTVEEVDAKYDEAFGGVKDRYDEFVAAQYASNYNRLNDSATSEDLKIKSQNMMADMEKQITELTGSDSDQGASSVNRIEAFREAVVPFDAAVSELCNITFDEIMSYGDIPTELAAKYDSVLAIGNDLMDQGYGYGYITRVDNMMAVGATAIVDRVYELKLSDMETFISGLKAKGIGNPVEMYRLSSYEDDISVNLDEVNRLYAAASYYKDNMSANSGEINRAFNLLKGYLDKFENVDQTKADYVAELNEQLKHDYSGILPRDELESKVKSLNLKIAGSNGEYAPRNERIKALREEYESVMKAYFENYEIAASLKEKNGNDSSSEFDKDLAGSKERADELLFEIDKIEREISEKAGDHEDNVAERDFYNSILENFEKNTNDLYNDALSCYDLIDLLGGKPAYYPHQIDMRYRDHDGLKELRALLDEISRYKDEDFYKWEKVDELERCVNMFVENKNTMSDADYENYMDVMTGVFNRAEEIISVNEKLLDGNYDVELIKKVKWDYYKNFEVLVAFMDQFAVGFAGTGADMERRASEGKDRAKALDMKFSNLDDYRIKVANEYGDKIAERLSALGNSKNELRSRYIGDKKCLDMNLFSLSEKKKFVDQEQTKVTKLEENIERKKKKGKEITEDELWLLEERTKKLNAYKAEYDKILWFVEFYKTNYEKAKAQYDDYENKMEQYRKEVLELYHELILFDEYPAWSEDHILSVIAKSREVEAEEETMGETDRYVLLYNTLSTNPWISPEINVEDVTELFSLLGSDIYRDDEGIYVDITFEGHLLSLPKMGLLTGLSDKSRLMIKDFLKAYVTVDQIIAAEKGTYVKPDYTVEDSRELILYEKLEDMENIGLYYDGSVSTREIEALFELMGAEVKSEPYYKGGNRLKVTMDGETIKFIAPENAPAMSKTDLVQVRKFILAHITPDGIRAKLN